MQHVDEDRLHAYLDGELAGDAAERTLLERHLEGCPECAARLREVVRLREAGRALLAGATSVPVHQPPFEVVVARAKLATSRRRARPAYVAPLAWAASVVVALGAGWLARDLIVGGAGDSQLAMEAPATAPATPPVAMTEAQQAGGTTYPESGSASATLKAGPTLATADRAPEAEEAAVGSIAGADQAMSMEAVAPPAIAVRGVENGAIGEVAALSSREAYQARGEASEALAAAGASAPAAPPPPPTLRAQAARQLDAQSSAAAWRATDLPGAEAHLGMRVLTYPGSRRVGMEIGSVDGRPVVRSALELPGGEVVTLVQGRALAGTATAPTSRLETAAVGTGVLETLTRDGAIVVGRAGIGRERLRAILAGLQ